MAAIGLCGVAKIPCSLANKDRWTFESQDSWLQVHVKLINLETKLSFSFRSTKPKFRFGILDKITVHSFKDGVQEDRCEEKLEECEEKLEELLEENRVLRSELKSLGYDVESKFANQEKTQVEELEELRARVEELEKENKMLGGELQKKKEKTRKVGKALQEVTENLRKKDQYARYSDYCHRVHEYAADQSSLELWKFFRALKAEEAASLGDVSRQWTQPLHSNLNTYLDSIGVGTEDWEQSLYYVRRHVFQRSIEDQRVMENDLLSLETEEMDDLEKEMLKVIMNAFKKHKMWIRIERAPRGGG